MQVVTNEALARGQMRKGNALLVAALLVYLVGFAQGVLLPANPFSDSLSLGGVVLGTALWLVSQYYTRRWAPRFRQDGPLKEALKRVDNRSTLLSFAASQLPDYLLVGPQGVRVLVARGNDGTIRCRQDRWSRAQTPSWLMLLVGDPLRNPSAEAKRSVAQVQRYLERALGAEAAADAPVDATIVFTNPRARLEIEMCSYPVALARDLRASLQRDKGTLRPPEIAKLRQALEPQTSSAAS
ncbi:MAG TPA: hypothetical protein VII06_16365 [Chloroflexota bacterium]